MPMLQSRNLTKRYGATTVVDGVSFELSPGEVLGFLGPNGAGKSTTMRMIAGFIAPSAGTATLCGHDIGSEPLAAKRCLGYLPEGAPSYGDMTVEGFLGFIADLRQLKGVTRRARLEHVVDRLQLGAVLRQTIETLSKGFRRRVGLAQAILHDPAILILDEPTDGLDPNQKQEVRALIGEMSQDKAIIVSTHLLEEVDAVCTRVVVIARGRLVANETPTQLLARSRYRNAVSFRLDDASSLESVRAALAALPEVGDIEFSPRDARLTVLPRKPGTDVLEAVRGVSAASRAAELGQLAVETGRLDEVFRSITR